jgi:hypothetical protein
MNRLAAMWWKLAGLAAGTGLLLFVLTASVPGGTVKIKIDLPPGAQVSDAQATSVVHDGLWIANLVVPTVILAIAGWIAWRIVRHHRKSN